eukprot:gene6263-4512_t
MDCNAAGQMAQKLSHELMMAQQQQGGVFAVNQQQQQQQHMDPLMAMTSPTGPVRMPGVDPAYAQQQAMMRQAEMERAFQQINPNPATSQANVATAAPGINALQQQGLSAMAAALPGMMMSVPRSQFQSTFQGSSALQASPINVVNTTTTADNSWANALGTQEYAQSYENAETFLPPGQEAKSVEELTKNSQFYGFMDQIREKHILIDEVNGKVVAGPGPDPEEVEGDTEHLRQWAASEGLNMPASVFERPGVESGAAKTQDGEGAQMTDMDALYNDENADEWAEHFAQMQEKYEKSMNTCDYPFEENNPYRYTEDPLKEGMEMLQMSNLAEAALAFEAVCKKDNNNKEAWILLAKAQSDNEKDSLAIIALNNARRVDPSDIAVHAALAVAHTNECHVIPAMDAMKAWLANHPKYQHLGQMTIEPDPDQDISDEYSSVDPTRLREIVTLYTAALEMNPEDPDLFVNLGVVYNLSHDFAAAADSFKAAAVRRPNDATLWNRIGASLANGGQGREALSAYRKALDINPGYVRAMSNLAVSQSNLGNHQEAAKTIISALSIQRGTTDPTRKGLRESQSLWDLLRMCLNVMQRQDLVEMTFNENIEDFANLFSLGMTYQLNRISSYTQSRRELEHFDFDGFTKDAAKIFIYIYISLWIDERRTTIYHSILKRSIDISLLVFMGNTGSTQFSTGSVGMPGRAEGERRVHTADRDVRQSGDHHPHSPRCDPNYRLETADAFYGMPMKVTVSYNHDEVTYENNWYVERRTTTNKYIDYDWIKADRSERILTATFPALSPSHMRNLSPAQSSQFRPSDADSSLIFSLYTGGGWIRKGTFRTSQQIDIVNPLRSMEVRFLDSFQEQSRKISCAVRVRGVRSSWNVVVSSEGLRVAAVPLTTSGEGESSVELSIPCPRVSGFYDVSFRFGLPEKTSLGTKQLFLRHSSPYDCTIAGLGGTRLSSHTHALSVAPGQPFSVVCEPCENPRYVSFHPEDAIFLVCTDTTGKVPLQALQTASRVRISQHYEGEEVQVKAPREIGIFAVVLGLYHDGGAYLPAAKSLIFVTPLSQLPGAECTTEAVPRNSSLPSNSRNEREGGEAQEFSAVSPSAADSGSLCSVCQEQVVNVKLEPCNHVVLCDKCFDILREASPTLCSYARPSVVCLLHQVGDSS